MTSTPTPGATVSATVRLALEEPAEMSLQVAVASSVTTTSESLVVELDGEPVDVVEVDGGHGNRIHVVRAEAGELAIRYAAEVPVAPPPAPVVPDLAASLAWRRQSRYCPADLVEAFATRDLGALRDAEGSELGRALGSWVFERIGYSPGSSRAGDSAVDTLLSGQGVCRDFAHLTITMCRALGIPARLVAVYAPGLTPMDFHAVAEVAGPEGWEIVDATRLAPRSSLVRIATGLDAADTAFVTTLEGHLELLELTVSAVTLGGLPLDDHEGRAAIA